MPMRPAPLFARLLFPKAQPHLQRQLFKQLVAAIIIGLVIAGIVGAAMFYQAGRPPTR